MSKYEKAIDWIAHNDEPGLLEADLIINQISVLLVADVFEKSPLRVAFDIQYKRTGNENQTTKHPTA